jgi:methionyl-tRNA synthetase
MLPGYMAATAAMASAERDSRAWSRAWLDEEVRIVQFFGFQQAYFHLVLHPALLLAWREDANLPCAYVADDLHGRPGGPLAEATQGPAAAGEVRAGEVLEALDADLVRFVLACDRPERQRAELDGRRFAQLLEGELIGHWDAWLSNLLRRLRPRVGVPLGDERAKSLNEGYLAQLEALADLGLSAFQPRDFSPPRACRMMRAVVREGERLAAGSTRVGVEQSGADTGLWLEALTAVRLAQVASPVMPTFAATLWRGLGLRSRVAWTEARSARCSSRSRQRRSGRYDSLRDQAPSVGGEVRSPTSR